MRVLLTLPGLHRVPRGAEVAFESIAQELVGLGHTVTVYGSGPDIAGRGYRYRKLPLVRRERFEHWPTFPPFRDPSTYEGLTFAPGLLATYRPKDHDVTVSCGFPVDNLVLRRPRLGGRRPAHVFVTENGDWPAVAGRREARLFGCDGLVCTNPVYEERNRERWHCALIPNGVDIARFVPGPPTRARLDIPDGAPVVLMVSALIESKRVEAGIRAVAELPDVVLLVAGDGPLRDELAGLGRELLGDRYLQRTFAPTDMPDLYRSADVLLHASLFESFGNIYVEAAATGLPVVAHASPVTEWILGEHGALVDTEDHRLLVDTLERTLRDGRDRGATERSDDARSRFSWAEVGRQYERFLAEVIARRG